MKLDLTEAGKERYNVKLDRISKNINDPYTLSTKLMAPSNVPDVQYPDIYN